VPLRFSIRAQAPRGEFSAPAATAAPTHEVEVAVDSGEVSFGRALGSAIELPFPKVSARHARLFREAGNYRLEDLGSANGTRLAGRPLAPHAPEIIAIGELVEIGGVEIRFMCESPGTDAAASGGGTETLARRLVHDIFEACPPSECARLIVLSGPSQGRELVLSASGRVFKVGRGETCDLVLSDEDVSREHAAFERGAGGIVVRDLGAKNGIEVGGEKVAGQRSLRDGEVIRVGETRLRVIDPEDRYLRQMEAADVYQQAKDAVQEQAPGAALPSLLPTIAAAIAATVLLLALGLVLALAFVA